MNQHKNYQRTDQQRMKEPPAVLSTKDLAYLTDAMSWELLTMKKCHHFAKECNSVKIQQTIEKAGKMHEEHYKILLKHIDPGKTNYPHQEVRQ